MDEKAETKEVRVELRLTPTLMRKIEQWRSENPDSFGRMPSRNEAIERLLDIALATTKDAPNA